MLTPEQVEQKFTALRQGLIVTQPEDFIAYVEHLQHLQRHNRLCIVLMDDQTRVIEEQMKEISELKKQNAALNRLVLVGDEHLKKERAKHAQDS